MVEAWLAVLELEGGKVAIIKTVLVGLTHNCPARAACTETIVGY